MCNVCRAKRTIRQLIQEDEREQLTKRHAELIEHHHQLAAAGYEGCDVRAFMQAKINDLQRSRRRRTTDTVAIYRPWVHDVADTGVVIDDKVRAYIGTVALDAASFATVAFESRIASKFLKEADS